MALLLGLLLAMVGLLAGCEPAADQGEKSSPPDAPSAPEVRWQKDPVSEILHGQTLVDPYRWLEDEGSEAVASFLAWQSQNTASWLDRTRQETLENRLRELLDYPRESLPILRGDFVLTERNSGLQAQSVLYRQIGLAGQPEVLLDPNALCPDGTISLSALSLTRDGALMAYGLSQGGSDDQTLHVRRVATGEDLPDVLPHMRFASVAWAADGSGFWFNRYPDPDLRENNSVYWHRLGDPVSEAALVLALPEDPHLLLSPLTNWEGDTLFVAMVQGTDDRVGWMWRKVGENPAAMGGWTLLVEPGRHFMSFIGTANGQAYFLTDEGAPFRRVVATELTEGAAPEWKEIVPEQPGVLIDDVVLADGRMILLHTVDVHSGMEIRELDGSQPRTVELPEPGSVGGLSSRPDAPEIFYHFSSLSQPGTIYQLDGETGVSTLVRRSAIAFDATEYETRQVFVERDGVRIPMFVVARKGLVLDGSHPTLLYGYGGFGVSLLPVFQPSLIPWLEAGGVYAVANIRGGGEYGAAWHQAAMLGKRAVAFDDFTACAEYLIAEGFTAPDRLAIQGGSNGGLLVLAALQRRPELFAAVVAQVPVTDMLRFHRFGTGAFWTVEYGNAETDAEAFAWLRAYSPLHNIAPGRKYPPVLVITADGDDRVVPAHAFKFIAALQSEAGPGTYLLLHQTGAGHGAGKSLNLALQETAAVYTFLQQTLGGFEKTTAP